MRRFLFDWHLRLGYFAGALILIWSASGALMTLDPVFRKRLDSEPPKIKAAHVDAPRFAFPASRLPLQGASAVSLRSFEGRSWYEARWPDGRVRAFDAATGKPADAEVSPEAARARIEKALSGGRWTALGVERLTVNDDQYRATDLPVLRVPLAGPGAPVLYLSSRDGSVLKATTRWSRTARWLGMGIHTWNLEAWKRSADETRRWSLSLLVALPLASLALVAYALLFYRRRQARVAAPVATPVARRGAAVLVALSLIAGAPGQASAQAVAKVVLPRLGASFAFPAGAPALGLSALSAPSLGVPSLAPVAALAPTLSAPVLAAAAVVPAAARPARASVRAAASASAPLYAVPVVGTHESLETQVTGARAVFDGAVFEKKDEEVAAPSFVALASRLPAAAAPERPVPPGAPAPSAPRGPDRRALWGIYVTHAAHLLTLSAAWRVAWPLLAIELAGKAGLAVIGSTGALVEMATGLIAGAIVDRLLPSHSMAGAALIRAGVAVALASVAAAGGAGLPFLIGMFTVHSFALTAIHIGQSSAAPVAAGDAPGSLRKVNSILKIITAAVSIPGSLLGGWVVGSLGGPGALIAYAAANAFVLAPLYAWLMPKTAVVPRAAAAPAAAPVKSPGLWEAAKAIFSSRVLIGTLIAMAAGVVLVEPLRSTTLPIIASELSTASAAMLLGGFQAAFYAGQFAGNFILLKWGERLSNRAWILLGAAGLAAFWLFTLAPVHVGFAFAATALIGLLTQPISVVAKTVFQEEIRRIKPELLGRAMGVNNMVYRLTVSAGTALVGWAAVSAALGAAGTLAAAYTGVGLILVAAVAWLMRPAARTAKIGPSPAAGRARKIVLAAAALLASAAGVIGAAMLPFSPLQWHMTLGMITGPLLVWMATTGAVTILGPLLKKKLDPKLPEAPPAEGFGAFMLALADAERVLSAARPDFRPVSAQARRAAGRVWYEFEDAAGALAAVDGRDGRVVEPLITPAEARAAAELWLAGSRWSIAGEPELLTTYDEQYRKGELPAYRLPLTGPGRYDVYLSARDGRPVEALSRLARVLRWAGLGLHTFGFGLLKSRYDSVRRVAMPLLIAAPIILTVILAIVSRL